MAWELHEWSIDNAGHEVCNRSQLWWYYEFSQLYVDHQEKALRNREQERQVPKALAAWKAYCQREYIVVPGASYHTVALEDLTENEYQTIRRIDKPIGMAMANGVVVAGYWVDAFIRDLEMLLAAFVVPSPTPPLLSVGLLAE